jgi:hypothetical protein
MKYIRILDPDNLKTREENIVILDWREICKDIEDSENFLYSLLANIPFFNNESGILERTVLFGKEESEIEFMNSDVRIPVSEELSICYDV